VNAVRIKRLTRLIANFSGKSNFTLNTMLTCQCASDSAEHGMHIGHHYSKRIELGRDNMKVGHVRRCHPHKERYGYENYRREHPYLMYLESLLTRKREASNIEEKQDYVK
jgi:hypothetical protein